MRRALLRASSTGAPRSRDVRRFSFSSFSMMEIVAGIAGGAAKTSSSVSWAWHHAARSCRAIPWQVSLQGE